MFLVIIAKTPPPEKKYWHSKNIEDRGEWTEIFESIIAWFCTSHDFRKNLNADIIVNDVIISLEGKTIRYLSPSIRSVASLLFKAYQSKNRISITRSFESSPGVTVSSNLESDNYPKPWYHCKFNCGKDIIPRLYGTLFNQIHKDSIPLNVPAKTLAQAIVWIHYRR